MREERECLSNLQMIPEWGAGSQYPGNQIKIQNVLARLNDWAHINKIKFSREVLHTGTKQTEA